MLKVEKNTEKHTQSRSESDLRALTQRLNRIEGQVRGLRRMLETNSYCLDVLVQVSAVTAALNSFGKKLFEEYLRNHVVTDIRERKADSVDDAIDEVIATLDKILK